jgi:nicotinate-nucleotide adenylyltransferase
MQQIALFGTSADPPTTAHQEILAWLSERFDWVAVWAADNPFKGHQTPLKHRMTMLRLLIEELNSVHPNVWLYPELSQSRTIHTLEIAKQRWRSATFTLVVGSDLLAQLPRWHRADELLQEVNLLVVPRPGYPLSEADLGNLRQHQTQVAIADLIGLDTSSTAYREHRNSNGLMPKIKDYIHREHLYECRDAPTAKPQIWQPTPH